MLTTWLAASMLFVAQDKEPAAVAAPAEFELGAERKLAVLYAGVLETPRAQSFVEFLQANFDRVGALDVTKLSMATAAGYDVVVADGNRVYPMDPQKGLGLPKIVLGPDFTRPIVMLSALAGQMQTHTKIGWL